jgi:hypothetical protein
LYDSSIDSSRVFTIFTGLPVASASNAARQHIEVITSSLPPKEPPRVA